MEGDHWIPGPADRIAGVINGAQGGTTLHPVTLIGDRQPDLRSQISNFIAAHGAPQHAILIAGSVDLIFKVVLNVNLPLATYQNDYIDITQWLQDAGVDVHWVLMAPVTDWSVTAPVNWMRMELNAWLRTSGLPIIDCEASLIDHTGLWLREDYVVTGVEPPDGVHVNAAGATAHATCIAGRMGLQVKEPDPLVTSTTVTP